MTAIPWDNSVGRDLVPGNQPEQPIEDREMKRGGVALRAISAPDLRRVLDGIAEHLQGLEREALKDFLGGLVERIDLAGVAAQCRIHCRISTGDKLAFPRRGGDSPLIPSQRLAAAVRRRVHASQNPSNPSRGQRHRRL